MFYYSNEISTTRLFYEKFSLTDIETLQYKEITTVRDVKRLKRGSIDKIFVDTDPATEDMKQDLLQVAKYLRRGGRLRDNTTMDDVDNLIQRVDQRRQNLRSVLCFLAKAVVDNVVGEVVEEGLFEGGSDEQGVETPQEYQ